MQCENFKFFIHFMQNYEKIALFLGFCVIFSYIFFYQRHQKIIFQTIFNLCGFRTIRA